MPECFCQQHELNATDTALVCWLVQRHLYMSSVAQNQDIYDPDVVADFAREVKSQMRLDYLYALTVADINATNPTLWNGWRASLMRHLYAETRRLFQTQEEPMGRQESIRAYQESALEQLSPTCLTSRYPSSSNSGRTLVRTFSCVIPRQKSCL